MEEDTGKTTHGGAAGRIHDAEHALIDYNRAGVPLVEIVSRARHALARGGRRPTSASCVPRSRRSTSPT